MGKKLSKRTKKFAASGGLKNAIEARRKHQKRIKPLKAKQERRAAKDKQKARDQENEDPRNESEDELPEGTKFQGMTVDDFLKGDFMDEAGSQDGESGSEDGDGDDSASFASVDEFDDEEKHMQELSALAKKDPEFYKYLQEHDRELLEFSKADEDQAMDDDDEDEQEDDDEPRKKVLTPSMLKQWQSEILQYHSLAALRQLLVAFRSSANINDEKEGDGDEWTTENPELFNKLVVTALKYTPMVLRHHTPYKEMPDGRFKPPAQTTKTEKISKLVASFLSSIVKLVDQLSDADTHLLAITESAKLIPYVSHRRKAVKVYLKMCLELWSNGEDKVRLAAYMALRRLGSSYDVSLLDMVLKASYLTLVRGASKSNERTLPSLNLMKNTASELYCINPNVSYQHAFGYIRQLAAHLRNSMKVKSNDALKQVYNWQFVHCVDFWCMVLAKACDGDSAPSAKRESELRPLIYPLVQVTIGALKLGSGMRHYPLHLHLIRSLLHLIRHTKTYIPLAPFILPILTTPLSPTNKYHASKLKPLDLSVQIHVPNGYMKTRILADSMLEEATFVFGEWCETLQGSIAFPELMIPVAVTLKRSIKKSKGGKSVMALKVLLERIEDGCRWVEAKRSKVRFAPGDSRQVADWEATVDVADSPVAKWVKVQRKARAHKELMKKKAASGEGEMLEDEDEPIPGADDVMDEDSDEE